jgi:hypothetical protein
VTVATNTFINVPTILQYEDTPLLEVVQVEKAGFTTQIPIYHPDGTYLAKVVGSRLFVTENGKNAGLSLKFPQNKTVCELGGKTLFEIQREGAAALQAWAELYTPDGAFVKCAPDIMPILFNGEKPLKVGGVMMSGNVFQGLRIGIWIRKDGSINIGVG